MIQEENESINKTGKSKSFLEEGEKKKHWLDGKMKEGRGEKGKSSYASVVAELAAAEQHEEG